MMHLQTENLGRYLFLINLMDNLTIGGKQNKIS